MPYKFEQALIQKALREDPKVERRAIEQVMAVVYDVHMSHGGRPVAEVDAELRRRFAEDGFTPEEPEFSEVVRAIAQGVAPR